MNANEFDYYFIGSTYPDNVPLLTVDDIDRKSTMSIGFLSRNELVPENHVARVRFGDPIPRKPKLAVYHKSIVDIIMSVEPEGVCFTPVEEWNDGSQFDLFD